MSIYRTAVNKPVTTALLFVAFAIFGIFSFTKTSIALYPDFDANVILVMSSYPGASAADIETNLTKVLENGLNGVADLKDMTSKSKENISIITLEFNYGVEIEEATNNVRDKLDMISSTLPDQASTPIIFKFSADDMPILILSATADESLPGLDKILDDKVTTPLSRVKGVGTVSVTGAPTREIQVYCDPNKLQAYGLSISTVSSIIAYENRNIPSGSIDVGSDTYSLRIQKEFKDPSELLDIVLAYKNGDAVYLRDVATVRDGQEEKEQQAVTNGRRSAQIVIQKQTGAKPGSWFSLALTKKSGMYNFYVNSSLVKTVNNSGTLLGVSLNQDYYGGSWGFGLLDDVKFYNLALTQAELINEMSSSKQQGYLLDGVNFKEYGVYVSGSDGVLNRPKLKTPASLSWDNYHGESVDLMHKFYEPREITLSCFVKADSKMDFIRKVTSFQQQLDKAGTNRLTIDVHPVKPLIYEVYCKDAIEITKEWDDELMVGTFKLKLVEPEPVKRVLKHIRVGESTKTCNVKLTSNKYVNIYWGDGSVDYDISGDEVEITHNYAANGDYFPVITGCIDEISLFETNAIVVWEKI